MKKRCVVAFAGHMIDKPSRPSPRFPPQAEFAVQSAICDEIKRLSPTVAVSSAANGGDIIFAEEVLKQKIPLYIVLPFKDKRSFIRQSVAYAGKQWVIRFRKVCTQASGLYFVKPGSYEDERDFEDNQHAVIFFALGFAAANNMRIIPLILYDDSQPEDGLGGTISFLKLLTGLNIEFHAINMAAIRAGLHPEVNVRDKGRK